MEMVIKIDKQGRIVLPKEIREKYHFQQDTDILLIEQSEGLLLKPKSAKKSLKEIFSKAPKSKLDDALVIDVANYNENDV